MASACKLIHEPIVSSSRWRRQAPEQSSHITIGRREMPSARVSSADRMVVNRKVLRGIGGDQGPPCEFCMGGLTITKWGNPLSILPEPPGQPRTSFCYQSTHQPPTETWQIKVDSKSR